MIADIRIGAATSAAAATVLALAGSVALAPVPARAQMLVPAPPLPTDAASRSAPSNPTASLARPLAPGEQLVVVRGFRIREMAFDQRAQALHAGLMSTAVVTDCDTASCGFVVFELNGKYRYTSIVTGTDRELTAMAIDLEREGLSLVIVYPPASRLRRFYTPTESGMVAVAPELAGIGQPAPGQGQGSAQRPAPVEDTGGW